MTIMRGSNPTVPESLKRSVEASKAEYKRLGRSGLRVSIPILGAMSFGNARWMDWVLDEDEVRSDPAFASHGLFL